MKSISFLVKSALVFSLSLVVALVMPVYPAWAQDTPSNSTLTRARPSEDIARDSERKPAEMLAFAEIKPGQTVVDYIPGKGYFTRLFSNAVGPQGTVYSVTPQEIIDRYKDRPRPPSVALETGHENVHDLVSKGATLDIPTKADLVWTSQNYHDVHIAGGATMTNILNKAVFDSLKPGGLYIVLDHSALTGQDDATMKKLHRIERDVVIKEVTAAGFVLDGESSVLSNPNDPRNVPVFDASIRGKTDQFVLRFKKPTT